MPRLFILLIGVTAQSVAGDLVLEAFDGAAAYHWSLKQARIEIVPQARNGSSAALFHYPRWNRTAGKWPSARLRFGRGGFHIEDWRSYSSLTFKARSEIGRVAHIKLRVDDGHGRRALRVIPVASIDSLTTYRVAIAGLAEEIDISQVRLLDFYMTQPARDYEYAIDDIRLETEPLKLLDTKVWRDPLTAGSVRLEATLNQLANIKISIVNDQGILVGQGLFHDREIEFSWSPSQRAVLGKCSVGLTASVGSDTLHFDLGSIEIPESQSQPMMAAWVASSVEKVFLHSRPEIDQIVYVLGDHADLPSLRIDMARNEIEAAQLVLLSRDELWVQVEVGGLRSAEGDAVIPAASCRVQQVGFVNTRSPESYAVDFAGWWPDPLLPRSEFRLTPGEAAPLWISIATDESTPVGRYVGDVEVRASGEQGSGVLRVPLEVTVHRALLSDSTTVRTAFSLYEHMIDKVYLQVPHSGRHENPIFLEYRDFLGAHRLNITNLYRQSPPDYFDVADRARRGQVNAFNLINLPVRAYSPGELQVIADSLEPTVQTLRRLGLTDRAFVHGFDEATVADFGHLREAFSYLKGRFPDVRLMTTAQDPSFGLDSGLDDVVDIWVPLTSYYDGETAAAARVRGKEVWWYICIATTHPFANWFVEYPLVEARLLWWMTFHEHVDGFLYYALNRWPNQSAPLQIRGNSGRTDWDPASFETANGDGSLFYAGKNGPISSLRFENVRDGIEDYELLHMLAQKTGDHGEESRRLCKALVGSPSKFVTDPAAFADIRRELLNRLDLLITNDRARLH